jgi:hypothetical protein
VTKTACYSDRHANEHTGKKKTAGALIHYYFSPHLFNYISGDTLRMLNGHHQIAVK